MKAAVWLSGLGAALVAVVAFLQMALAQESSGRPPYTPAVPQAPAVAAYPAWGGYGGTTPAGSAMQGMASCINARGNYNLSTSAAAINMTVAESNDIQNAVDYTKAYWERKNVHDAEMAKRRRPPPTQEQMARWAQYGVPKPLASRQLDPVTGKIRWPIALTADGFSEQRAELESAFAQRAAHGALTLAQTEEVAKLTDAMLDQLDTMIDSLSPAQFTEARKFVASLAHVAQQPAA